MLFGKYKEAEKINSPKKNSNISYILCVNKKSEDNKNSKYGLKFKENNGRLSLYLFKIFFVCSIILFQTKYLYQSVIISKQASSKDILR